MDSPHAETPTLPVEHLDARNWVLVETTTDSQVFGMCINNWRPAVHYAMIGDENNRGGYLARSLETLIIYSK